MSIYRRGGESCDSWLMTVRNFIFESNIFSMYFVIFSLTIEGDLFIEFARK